MLVTSQSSGVVPRTPLSGAGKGGEGVRVEGECGFRDRTGRALMLSAVQWYARVYLSAQRSGGRAGKVRTRRWGEEEMGEGEVLVEVP
jgi:hypothetical protein